ncbi:MAG: hypothetical protein JWO08_3777 [Verrucomicrobiaceae bacterium]|nr:hypothetical protein [Verrucomicrobiaceae bacterium]
MVFSSDSEYLATKRIKRGEIRLLATRQALADWISTTYQVTVLNIIQDSIDPDNRPRLQIILEWSDDSQSFSYDKDKQEAVKRQCIAIAGDSAPSLQRLLVCFSAFESVAIAEAQGKVTEEETKALQTKINHPDIWLISRSFMRVFFYTQAQVNLHQKSELAGRLTTGYWNLLACHDEFGYIKKRGFELSFDSKENFDQVYEGSWFYYFR